MEAMGTGTARGWRDYFFYFAHVRPSALGP